MKHNLQIKDKDGFIYDVHDVVGNIVTALTDSGKHIDFNKSDVLFILQGVPVDYKYLFDWYIQSVDAHTPVWTEGHLEELLKDFYLIPKNED